MWWLSNAFAAQTLVVGPGGPYPTIDLALLDARDGDRIEVEPGVYEGSLEIRHDVTLVSTDGAEVTSLIPPSTGDPRPAVIVSVGATLTVSGFTFDGRDIGPGLYLDAGEVVGDHLVFFGGREADLVSYGGQLTLVDATFGTPSVGTYGHGYVEDSVLDFDGVTFADGSGDSGGAMTIRRTTATFRRSTFVDNTSTGDGGALLIDGADGHVVTIEDSTFEHNVSRNGWGGGILQYGGVLSVVRTTFVDNVAGAGSGAFELSGASFLRLEDSTIEHNTSTALGAGVVVYNTDQAEIVRSTFTGNQTENQGAGLMVLGTVNAVELAGSTFCDNTSAGAGGALYLASYGSLDASVHHNVFVGNRAGGGGAAVGIADAHVDFAQNTIVDSTTDDDRGAIWVDVSGVAALTNNVLVNNVGAAAAVDPGGVLDPAYTLLWGNDRDLVGIANSEIVEADPGFVAYIGSDCSSDLRPATGSAMIDAGDPTRLDDDGSRSDLGAYGGPGASLVLDLDGDGAIADDCAPYDPLAGAPGDDLPADGLDPDCDGVEPCFVDGDGDGVGSDTPGDGPLGCTTTGFAPGSGDCDDADPTRTTDCAGIDPEPADPDEPAAAALPRSWFCATGGPPGAGWPLGFVLFALRRRQGVLARNSGGRSLRASDSLRRTPSASASAP